MNLPFACAGKRFVLPVPSRASFDAALHPVTPVFGKLHRAALRTTWIAASESPYVATLPYPRFYKSPMFERITRPYSSLKFLQRWL